MDIFYSIILTVHLLAGAALIGLVLLQHGKGADMGAAFGSGASGSLFGASGSANFLSRATAILATVFFLTSLGLSYLATAKPRTSGSVVDRIAEPAVAPAVPEAPAANGSSKAGDIPK